jgi:hypothetical protein
MKRAANKTICTEFKAINVIISGYQHSMKNIYLGFLNFTNRKQQVVVF